MIRNQWYVVLESKQVGRKPVGVTRMGEKLVFWRDQADHVHCLRDRCAHRGVALSIGDVVEGEIRCPFHGFQYDASGQCTLIPANGRAAAVPERFKVHAYPTHEAHGFIWIWWGDAAPADLAPPRFFEDIDATFYYATVYDPWATHYSRVLENQLDVMHLPFVHHNTIGRGNRTLVDGPGVEWADENRMRVYVYNRLDDGTPPRKPEEVPIPNPNGFCLELEMPNLWQNRISDDVRVVAAFVPVDEAHTLLYLRFYQRFLPVPLLGKVVAWLAMPYNRIIAHQDRRVVVTQRPRPSGLRIGENLAQGDRPIAAYRMRRQELLDAVNRET